MSEARTSLGPVTSSVNLTGSSEYEIKFRPFKFKMISVTSSFTYGIDENSWATPSMDTDVTAAPFSVLSSTRRNAFPRVVPKPGSSGSISNFP